MATSESRAPMRVGIRYEIPQQRDDGLACGGEPRVLIDQVERLVDLCADPRRQQKCRCLISREGQQSRAHESASAATTQTGVRMEPEKQCGR